MKDFETGKKDDWVSCLKYCSGLPMSFIVFVLFYSFVRCRSLMLMQMQKFFSKDKYSQGSLFMVVFVQ